MDIAAYLVTASDLGEYTLQLLDSLSESLGTSELDLVVLNTAALSLASRILQNRKLPVDKNPERRCAYDSFLSSGTPLFISMRMSKRRSPMRIKSSGSVKIISLDIAGIRESLAARARELKRKDRRMLNVFLFGSLAKGTTMPGG